MAFIKWLSIIYVVLTVVIVWTLIANELKRDATAEELILLGQDGLRLLRMRI